MEKVKVELFIALWSVNESPHELREKIFRLIDANYYLFAFSKDFSGTDDIAHFEKLAEGKPWIDWKTYIIPSCPNSYYLVGKQRRS
jgi:hypothetical protein